jgi:hypothetical protein
MSARPLERSHQWFASKGVRSCDSKLGSQSAVQEASFQIPLALMDLTKGEQRLKELLCNLID